MKKIIKYLCPITGHEIPKRCCLNCKYYDFCISPKNTVYIKNIIDEYLWNNNWNDKEDYCSKFKLKKQDEYE